MHINVFPIYITLNNATKYPSVYQIIVVIPIFDYLNLVTALKTTFRVLGLEVRIVNIITTFSNISAILWMSALWVYNVVSSTPRQEQDVISQRKWR